MIFVFPFFLYRGCVWGGDWLSNFFLSHKQADRPQVMPAPTHFIQALRTANFWKITLSSARTRNSGSPTRHSTLGRPAFTRGTTPKQCLTAGESPSCCFIPAWEI